MGTVIGEILPLALAIAISPVPIIAVILLLFTDRPKPDAGAFVVGFYVGVAVVLGVFIALASTQDIGNTGSTPSDTSYVVKIVIGALLLVVALRQFRKRPAAGEEPPQPKWMAGISSFTVAKSLVTGLVVGAINPKNIAMSLAASITIASASLSAGGDVAVTLIYALIGTAGVAAPFLVAVAMGDRSEPTLDSWKAWLSHNNAVVMAVLFLVIGVVIIGDGISGLSA